jgi:hypothetical protein
MEELRAYRPPSGSVLPDHLIWPRYEGRSVGNLAATAAQALGATLPGVLPPLADDLLDGPLDGMLDGVERIVLLVMDALGWRQLQRVMRRYDDLVFHRLAERGRLLPLTTTCLSTTNSVLSSIWTGRPPAQHGLLAFELWLREWMMVVESIGFSSPFEMFANTLLRWDFEPEDFLPVPSVGELLKEQGITTVAATWKQFTTTPLSLMHHRGTAEVWGHSYGSDFWLNLRRILAAHRGRRLLVGGYWSAVDTLAHRYGPEDETGDMEIRTLGSMMEDIFLKRLPAEDRASTLFLMTADHGQITTLPERTVVLEDHPRLRDMLWLPNIGEGRVPFFYVRHGHYDGAMAYLNDHFGDDFAFLSRKTVLESGLLGPGPIYEEVPFRLGDIVGFALSDGAFARTRKDAERLRGRHGGLTEAEMVVPLLALRLDA